MKDPNLNPTADIEVIQSVYNISQGIRDWILTQSVLQSNPIDLLETLYNTANRLVTQYNANTLSTFLATFTLRFHHWLFRIVLQNHDIFGTNNNAMVSSIETLYLPKYSIKSFLFKKFKFKIRLLIKASELKLSSLSL